MQRLLEEDFGEEGFRTLPFFQQYQLK